MKRLLAAVIAILFSACAAMPMRAAGPSDEEKLRLPKIISANPYQQSIRLGGWVEVHTDKGWLRSKASVVLDRPHNLKVMFFDPLGTAWFMATANSQTVFYAAPNDGIRDLLPRKEGHPIKIGGISLNPDDVIMGLHPGMEPKLLEGAKVDFQKNGGLRLHRDSFSQNMEFDSQGRITGSVVLRDGQAPLRLSYVYGDAPAYTVQINGDIRFQFQRVEEMKEIPDTFFDPPPEQ